jgi:hypothetical protein
MSEVFCFLILFVTMTIAFAIGSVLVKLLFYSAAHGYDDNSIDIMDDLEEGRVGSSRAQWYSTRQNVENYGRDR